MFFGGELDVFRTLANSGLWLVIFAQFVGIPSFLLYLAEAIVLFRNANNEFGTPFYRLFIARFIANGIYHLNSYVHSRCGIAGVFQARFERFPQSALKYTTMMNYFSFHAENIATFMILLSRCTAVLTPLHHKNIWRRLQNSFIALIFLIPLPLAIFPNLVHTFFVRGNKNPPYNFGISYKGEYKQLFLSNSFLAAIMSFTVCVMCLALNAITFLKYKQAAIADQNSSVHDVRHYNLERRITIYAVVTFFSQACVFLEMVLFYILKFAETKVISSLFNFTPLIADICTLAVPAWLMLWASTDVRFQVLRFIIPGRFWSKMNLTVSKVIQPSLNTVHSHSHSIVSINIPRNVRPFRQVTQH